METGDANDIADEAPVPASNVIAKYSKVTIPYLGYYFNFLKTTLGSALLLIIPGLLLIIGAISSLMREVMKLEREKAVAAKKDVQDTIAGSYPHQIPVETAFYLYSFFGRKLSKYTLHKGSNQIILGGDCVGGPAASSMVSFNNLSPGDSDINYITIYNTGTLDAFVGVNDAATQNSRSGDLFNGPTPLEITTAIPFG